MKSILLTITLVFLIPYSSFSQLMFNPLGGGFDMMNYPHVQFGVQASYPMDPKHYTIGLTTSTSFELSSSWDIGFGYTFNFERSIGSDTLFKDPNSLFFQAGDEHRIFDIEHSSHLVHVFGSYRFKMYGSSSLFLRGGASLNLINISYSHGALLYGGEISSQLIQKMDIGFRAEIGYDFALAPAISLVPSIGLNQRLYSFREMEDLRFKDIEKSTPFFSLSIVYHFEHIDFGSISGRE